MHWPGVELATSRSEVQHLNHYTTEPTTTVIIKYMYSTEGDTIAAPPSPPQFRFGGSALSGVALATRGLCFCFLVCVQSR